eukprot:5475-Heterococcus_DN1.PRE.3
MHHTIAVAATATVVDSAAVILVQSVPIRRAITKGCSYSDCILSQQQQQQQQQQRQSADVLHDVSADITNTGQHTCQQE